MSNSSEADFAISFTYRDLAEATGDFHPLNLLGEGGFGAVYRGSLRHQQLAVKRLNEVGWSDG